MPTYHKAQLTETSTPFLEVREFMRRGLDPVARKILETLKFYEERGIEPSAPGEPLYEEEKEELSPVITAFTVAAVLSEEMKPGPLVSTLARLRKEPDLYSQDILPAIVLWELAQDYQRDSEPPGTFGMDIWGTDQTAVSYNRVAPTKEAIALAADRARARVQRGRSPGRRDHPAYQDLARRLAPIFAKTEFAIDRRAVIDKCRDGVPHYTEAGEFFQFLELILPPLRQFLQERRLAPVTTGSIVRAAQKYVAESLEAHPLSTPDYSHESDEDIFGDPT